jgi:hypothetical protein
MSSNQISKTLIIFWDACKKHRECEIEVVNVFRAINTNCSHHEFTQSAQKFYC